MRSELRGTARFLFQPAEEIAAGAQRLIDAGALQGVDAALGFHNKPDLPLDSAVVSFGQFHAGTTHNVIPDAARLDGTVRTFTPQVRDRLAGVLRRIATAVAAGFGAEARVEYAVGTPAVNNDARICELVRRAAAATVGEARVVEAQPVTASEDFALYQQQVPGHFAWLGVGNPAIGAVENWHHPRFIVDEAAIPVGVRLFTLAALNGLD